MKSASPLSKPPAPVPPANTSSTDDMGADHAGREPSPAGSSKSNEGAGGDGSEDDGPPAEPLAKRLRSTTSEVELRTAQRPRYDISGAAALAAAKEKKATDDAKRAKTAASRRVSGSNGPSKSPRTKGGRSKKRVNLDDLPPAIDDDEEDDGSITRCICGLNDPDDDVSFWIMCEACKCWQHGLCVGIEDEASAPEKYFCEKCAPDMHASRTAKRDSASSKRRSSSKQAGGRISPPVADEVEDVKPTRRVGKRRASQDDANVEVADDSKAGPFSAEAMPPPPSTHRRTKSRTVNESTSPTLDPPALSPQLAALANPKSVAYPPTSHFALANGPRRRSTMNSHNTTFEEQLAATLAMSQAEAREKGIVLPTSEPSESVFEEDADEPAEEAVDGDDAAREPSPAPVARSAARSKRPASGNKRRRSDEEEECVTVVACVADARRPRRSQSPSQTGSVSDETVTSGTAPAAKRQRGGRFVKKAKTAKGDDGDEPARPRPLTARAKGKGKEVSHSPGPASPAVGSGAETATSATRKSPAKRKAATAAASAIADERRRSPPQPTRRNGKAWSPADALAASWGLPDHLSHLAHLLPSMTPLPITLGTSTPINPAMPPPLVAPAHERGVSPSSSSNGGNATAPHEIMIESAHRVRYPMKRTTMPDMRRRTTAMLDYLSRVSVDLSTSSKRAHTLGLAEGLDGAAAIGLPALSSSASSSSSSAHSSADQLSTATMLDNLQKEISRFNDRFFAPLARVK